MVAVLLFMCITGSHPCNILLVLTRADLVLLARALFITVHMIESTISSVHEYLVLQYSCSVSVCIAWEMYVAMLAVIHVSPIHRSAFDAG